ncbi:MAG: hypothetical protein JSR20_05215 [Nitrospira sp.]|nr:hypothetical protein [Nitrospira sp.]
MNQVLRGVGCVGLVVLAGLSMGGGERAWAVPKETSTEKAEHLRQQANPQLFNHWTFDKDQLGSVPAGFTAVAAGDQPSGVWKVATQAAVPSAPNMLVGTAGCEGCRAILIAQGFQYEYPELVVRIQQGTDGASGQVGVVFGMKDPQNYYATIVDVAQKVIQVVRVIEGKESVIGRAPIKAKPVDWHTLRIQRNTIISKDFIETFFDGSLALSVEDQALGVGQVGMLVLGLASARFDNFNAAPLYSSRPLSAPAAY